MPEGFPFYLFWRKMEKAYLKKWCHLNWGKCYKTFYGCPWFVCKAKSLPESGAPERCFTWTGSSLTRKHYTKLERIFRNKHSSLLRTFVIYEYKKFYNIEPRTYNILFQLLQDQRINRNVNALAYLWEMNQLKIDLTLIMTWSWQLNVLTYL